MRGVLVLTRTMGDVLLANVLIDNIVEQYPGIELDYIVEKKYVDLVKGNPHLKGCRVLEETGSEWNRVLQTLATEEYDKLFFAQQTTAEDNNWHQMDKYRFGHLLDFYAQRCGVKIKDRALRYYPQSDVFVKELKGSFKVLCHTTTLGDAKNWSRFTELKNLLISEGFELYQVGLKTDLSLELDEEHDLREKYTLPELAKLFKQADCFVGLDSGLSYLAAAVGLNVICIMGASIPLTSGPYGHNVSVVHSGTRDECSEKRCHGLRGTCSYGSKCIDRIDSLTVFRGVQGLRERSIK